MVELPTSRKGAATSRRILDAATAEFAERGIAGARVDRIVAAAQTNKAQLYGYFGSKDGLFDAVLADLMDRSSSDVPFDVDDLPGWAVAVYDGNLRHAELVRLLAWARLEGRVVDHHHAEPKLKAIAEAQAAGRIRAGDPGDILALVIAMASTWSPASGVFPATTADDERRALLRDAVHRVVTGLPASGPHGTLHG